MRHFHLSLLILLYCNFDVYFQIYQKNLINALSYARLGCMPYAIALRPLHTAQTQANGLVPLSDHSVASYHCDGCQLHRSV